MVTILLIADQDRLTRLFNFTNDYPQIGVRISRSLRQGIEDIAQEPPTLLFIQNHLSGLSGEIIARHLVAGLEGNKPKVVLFGERDRTAPVPGVIDACLDVGLGDEELTAAIITLISECATPSHPAGEAEPASPFTHRALSAEEVPAEPGEEAPVPPVAPESPFDRKLQTALDETPSPVSLTDIEDTVALGVTTDERASLPPPPKKELHRRGRAEAPKAWLYLTAVGLLAAGALLFFLLRPGEEPKPAPPAAAKPAPAKAPTGVSSLLEPKPTVTAPHAPSASSEATRVQPPAATAPSPAPQAPAPTATAPAGKGLDKLPGFIPREGIDKGYAAAHPGWERYRGARTEFKVYRSDSLVRAIQSIDRSGIGIPESFLRGALMQMTGTRDYAIQEKQAQGKFQVEKSTVATGARLVIYRTAPGGPIRAFVVYFQ